jgi:hypothetical protein
MTWVISAISILTIVIYGRMTLWGPILGFFSQGLWYWYLIDTKQWGLLPCTFGFGVAHAINWYKWRKKLNAK